MDEVTGWFTPERRKAIYGIVAAFGVIATILGATTGVADSWVLFIQSVMGVVFGLMAAYNARKVDWTILYLIGAVVSAAVGIGWVTDNAAITTNAVIAQIVTLLPPLVAELRTDTRTYTGEPLGEVG